MAYRMNLDSIVWYIGPFICTHRPGLLPSYAPSPLLSELFMPVSWKYLQFFKCIMYFRSSECTLMPLLCLEKPSYSLYPLPENAYSPSENISFVKINLVILSQFHWTLNIFYSSTYPSVLPSLFIGHLPRMTSVWPETRFYLFLNT